MSDRETNRLERQRLIEALLNDQDAKLDELVEATKKKHANGGLIKDTRTQMCIRVLAEEELDD